MCGKDFFSRGNLVAGDKRFFTVLALGRLAEELLKLGNFSRLQIPPFYWTVKASRERVRPTAHAGGREAARTPSSDRVSNARIVDRFYGPQ